MDNEIKFRDENHHSEGKKEWTDLEWMDEFYKFLQGKIPDRITITGGHQPKLNDKKAFTIIWYLQEHFRILPAHIEKCANCKYLFDIDVEGIYWETKGKHYCGGCDSLVPENYDRGKR
ncbi:MAG TPA: hypothetical protein ENH85_06290 [Candidatus Scalindua sp.]|nr:hypothetical protein [Candidatus Scalindua sp.]